MKPENWKQKSRKPGNVRGRREEEETHRMTSQGNMGENEGQREAQLHTR